MDHGRTDKTPPEQVNQVHTWCQIFEDRINGWLDERLPLKAELFFDETPPEGTAEVITLRAALVDESLPSDSVQTVEVSYSKFITALRAHVESCSDCGDLSLGYGDLQQVIWSLQAPQPAPSFAASAVAKISVEMQEKSATPESAEDQAVRETVEMRRTAETVEMAAQTATSEPDASAEEDHRTEVPRFNTAAITGRVAYVSVPESIDRDGTKSVAGSRGRMWLRRGIQLAAVAATVVIAVAIAFNTPDTITPGDGPLVLNGDNPDSTNNNTSSPRSVRMPTLSMFKGLGAFGSVLPNPNGGLVDEARNRSEAALEEMSGGLAPLADSAQHSAGFLQTLIPLSALGESNGVEQ